VEFGFGANRARVERTGFRNLWHAECKMMGLHKASSINMAKTLVPKMTLVVACELLHKARGGRRKGRR
jgi:hypothetical protein